MDICSNDTLTITDRDNDTFDFTNIGNGIAVMHYQKDDNIGLILTRSDAHLIAAWLLDFANN